MIVCAQYKTTLSPRTMPPTLKTFFTSIVYKLRSNTQQRSSSSGPPLHVIVLGFYDRDNLGDETYKQVFPMLFDENVLVSFFCTDDLKALPVPTPDIVLCGGGDIINPYFMDKVIRLTQGYYGPMYALSVGIPYPADAHYLQLFDHVFVRTQTDFELACGTIGAPNVTYTPDLSLLLTALPSVPPPVLIPNSTPVVLTPPITPVPSTASSPHHSQQQQHKTNMNKLTRSLSKSLRSLSKLSGAGSPKRKTQHGVTPYVFPKPLIHIGFSLAQPVFLDQRFAFMFKVIVDVMVQLMESNDAVRIHLFAFNTHSVGAHECDLFLNEKIQTAIPDVYTDRVTHHQSLRTPLDMMATLKTMHVNVCMRFHSMMFAMMCGTPVVAMYTSRKVRNLWNDFNVQSRDRVDSEVAYAIDLDAYSCDRIPDQEHVMLKKRVFMSILCSLSIARHLSLPSIDVEALTYPIYHKKLKQISQTLSRPNVPSYEMCVDKVITMMQKMFHVDATPDVNDIRALDTHGESPVDVARIICYGMTNNTDNACVWGLADNLKTSTFKLHDAMYYIYQDHIKKLAAPHAITATVSRSLESLNIPTIPITPEVYYPMLSSFSRECFVSIDPYNSTSFAGIHRAGWSYVVDHLMNLDAKFFMRSPTMIIDTFIDRTFHWAAIPLTLAGHIPYERPWMGFIHHTFDETHSDYNCVTLFKKPTFLASLPHCKGLFSLTEYLAVQIRDHLKTTGFEHIPVYVLTHPTEFPTLMFDMDHFLKNPDRKVVQIGAWLRRPYSIYKLPLPADNSLHIQKSVLKGKDMDLYFKPPHFIDQLQEFLQMPAQLTATDIICRPTSCICRPDPTAQNKYLQGLLEHILSNDASVLILEKLDNDAYDLLMSQNIIFLDLVDCSAVNTVLECIVRNTVLIVNRHPAVEEILGKEYPGFYSNAYEAACLLQDLDALRKIYDYLTQLPKEALKIETFMHDFQKAVVSSMDL